MEPYIVSEDIYVLLKQWAEHKGFTLPPEDFFSQLRAEMKAKLERFLPRVILVSERELLAGIGSKMSHSRFPSVSLDHVYASTRFLLKWSRLVDDELEGRGRGSASGRPIEEQIQLVVADLRKEGIQEVQLVDDVVFSGKTAANVIREFTRHGVRVRKIVCGIAVEEGKALLKGSLPDVELDYLYFFPEVFGEICSERSFYAGVSSSGRLLVDEKGKALVPEVGVPYFLPFGKPVEWASIPKERANEWSKFCLLGSAKLWREIEKASGKAIGCKDLGRLPRTFSRDESSVVERLERLVKDY